MLSSHKAHHAPELHINTRLVLAMGAYQASMRAEDSGAALVDWLHGYAAVRPAAVTSVLTVVTVMNHTTQTFWTADLILDEEL